VELHLYSIRVTPEVLETLAMWKPVMIGTAALMIAGSTFVLAQNRPDDSRRSQFTMQDMRAFADARLAGLKAGLVLTPDQEKNWPAFRAGGSRLPEAAPRSPQHGDWGATERHGRQQ